MLVWKHRKMGFSQNHTCNLQGCPLWVQILYQCGVSVAFLLAMPLRMDTSSKSQYSVLNCVNMFTCYVYKYVFNGQLRWTNWVQLYETLTLFLFHFLLWRPLWFAFGFFRFRPEMEGERELCDLCTLNFNEVPLMRFAYRSLFPIVRSPHSRLLFWPSGFLLL